ncbi:MAG: GDP-L-fucose synthase [Gammaproteobacteria bacterium]|nr:GDP-L-fucose synthase [Gammaproteobacteria bacterium]
MNLSDKIYVAGHRGLVGSAIVRALRKQGYTHLVLRTHAELDLTQQQQVYDFFAQEKPDYVFLAAAKVGGIHANNTYRGEFIFNNLAIELNVIEAARCFGAKKLVFFGSSCSYPRLCPQPMKEAYLLTGPLEPTNEPYAIAKIAGLKLCEAYNAQYGTQFISLIPTSLYGPNDNFDLATSHVLPALICKLHQAKIKRDTHVSFWGTGAAYREFLHADDLASACLFLTNTEHAEFLINIGTGQEITIRDLITLVQGVVGFSGDIVFDSSKPDGAPRKLLDTSRLTQLGWHASLGLEEGVRDTYRWFLENRGDIPLTQTTQTS